MKHFVYKEILFTVGKDWEENTDEIRLMYVNCQWQNSRKEQCDMLILVVSDRVEKALEGDLYERESIFILFARYLMLSFNPSIVR